MSSSSARLLCIFLLFVSNHAYNTFKAPDSNSKLTNATSENESISAKPRHNISAPSSMVAVIVGSGLKETNRIKVRRTKSTTTSKTTSTTTKTTTTTTATSSMTTVKPTTTETEQKTEESSTLSTTSPTQTEIQTTSTTVTSTPAPTITTQTTNINTVTSPITGGTDTVLTEEFDRQTDGATHTTLSSETALNTESTESNNISTPKVSTDNPTTTKRLPTKTTKFRPQTTPQKHTNKPWPSGFPCVCQTSTRIPRPFRTLSTKKPTRTTASPDKFYETVTRFRDVRKLENIPPNPTQAEEEDYDIEKEKYSDEMGADSRLNGGFTSSSTSQYTAKNSNPIISGNSFHDLAISGNAVDKITKLAEALIDAADKFDNLLRNTPNFEKGALTHIVKRSDDKTSLPEKKCESKHPVKKEVLASKRGEFFQQILRRFA